MGKFIKKILLYLWSMIWRLLMLMIILMILPFTPIFANLSVFALNTFSKITLDDAKNPAAMVVLGGGLTKQNDQIALNHYSQSRADATVSHYQNTPMPIITSGAESPWLQDYLKEKLNRSTPIISDNASMNTCENAVFTAKLLAHHEIPNSVYLITDRYHMARARRQFTLSGIKTLPKTAPLSMPLSWTNIHNNLIHSRRAVYEMVALARDIFRPQENCRTSEEITLEEISTPRRKPKIFS